MGEIFVILVGLGIKWIRLSALKGSKQLLPKIRIILETSPKYTNALFQTKFLPQSEHYFVLNENGDNCCVMKI